MNKFDNYSVMPADNSVGVCGCVQDAINGFYQYCCFFLLLNLKNYFPVLTLRTNSIQHTASGRVFDRNFLFFCVIVHMITQTSAENCRQNTIEGTGSLIAQM